MSGLKEKRRALALWEAHLARIVAACGSKVDSIGKMKRGAL